MYKANELKEELNAKGWKYTLQRDMILQVFQDLPKGQHLSPEELYQILTEDGKAVSLSTVYRSLKVLVMLGLLREVALAKSHKYYEIKQGVSHHHIVCAQCNHIVEFDNYSVLKEAWQQAEKAGVQLLDCQVTLHTVCSEAVQMGWPALSEDWVCSRLTKSVEAEILNEQPSHSKIEIDDRQKVLCQIELTDSKIIFYILKDESNSLAQNLKSIEGWRFSRKDNGWYFPIAKALDILNFLNQVYKIELINADIIKNITQKCLGN
ncbi:transcriptional repressor [Nostoc sp. FACHB-145]|nr:transcriptional repressor [Nostoc sp. FACHB-145]